MASRPLCAGVVQKASADIAPERVRTVETGSIIFWISTVLPQRARHPQWDFVQPLLLARPGTSSRTCVIQECPPVVDWEVICRSEGRRMGSSLVDRKGMPDFQHLLHSGKPPACGTVGHPALEHIKNKRVESVRRINLRAAGQ